MSQTQPREQKVRKPAAAYGDVNPVADYFSNNSFNRSALRRSTVFEPYQRRVAEAATRLTGPARSIVDIGCGGAWLPIRLIEAGTAVECLSLVDNSAQQLDWAAQNIQSSLTFAGPEILLHHADATATGLADERADLVILSFLVHIFADEGLSAVLSEARRLLRPEGHLLILTWLPEHLSNNLMNRFIPEYSFFDLARYRPHERLRSLLRASGFRAPEAKTMHTTYEFPSVAAANSWLREEPFSTFALMRQKKDEREMRKTFLQAENNLRDEFGSGCVWTDALITMLNTQKEIR